MQVSTGRTYRKVPNHPPTSGLFAGSLAKPARLTSPSHLKIHSLVLSPMAPRGIFVENRWIKNQRDIPWICGRSVPMQLQLTGQSWDVIICCHGMLKTLTGLEHPSPCGLHVVYASIQEPFPELELFGNWAKLKHSEKNLTPGSNELCLHVFIAHIGILKAS